jgi:tetratricopeptide (TPR) repeat protein
MVPSSNPLPDSKQLADADAVGRVLERDVPISQSLVWKRQREFYLQRGLKAWTEDQVPSYITNNPSIAEIYARIVCAYVRDCIELSRQESRPVSSTNPIRILELGAGSGKFSYLFLRELTRVLRSQGIDAVLVRYCMTDAADGVLDEWRRNDHLAEFVANSMLEFELFRAGEGIQSPFLTGKNTGAQEPVRGPLVVIANYVFDSLPQDAFRIEQGQISEFLLTTSGSNLQSEASSSGDGNALEAMSRLKFSFRNALVPRERYPNPTWNIILDGYRAGLSPEPPANAATVLFPCAALAALEEIARCTDGRMLVLAADKGFAHEDLLALSQAPPAFEFHADNCFSQMVNLDAIGKYFEAGGGRALRPDKHTATFNICAFLANQAGERFPAIESAYREIQQGFGPDDLFTVLAWLNAHMEEMTVPQILAVLRLTRWDTTTLMRLFPVLTRQLRTVVVERYDLREAVMRTWANHYPVSHGDNVVAFQCGVILLELKFFEEAAGMFRASQKLLGPSAPTSYNLGLCAAGLGSREEALAAMKEACELDCQFQPAQDALKKLESENALRS